MLCANEAQTVRTAKPTGSHQYHCVHLIIGMKRAYSEDDSQDEKGYIAERCIQVEDDETTARKRRRGLIEKKRRDRINSCLTELRRLVPTAVDKHGSTKLEKAEILQLTVEHLRNVRNFAKRDPASSGGADYRAAGFRECLSEVSRYLQTFQDPSCKEDQKTKLMSHLNSIITHRLTASSQVYQSRTLMTPSVAWPPVQSVPGARAIYHDTATTLPLAVAKMKTGQTVPDGMCKNQIEKDNTLIKNSNVPIPAPVVDVGIRPVDHYPFTMYPNAHCSRNNMMIRYPFLQHRDEMPKSEQIVYEANQRARGGALIPL